MFKGPFSIRFLFEKWPLSPLFSNLLSSCGSLPFNNSDSLFSHPSTNLSSSLNQSTPPKVNQSSQAPFSIQIQNQQRPITTRGPAPTTTTTFNVGSLPTFPNQQPSPSQFQFTTQNTLPPGGPIDQQRRRTISNSGGTNSNSNTNPTGGGRKRGDSKKCRKVFGIENKDKWCKACIWKKACQRFPD